MAKKGTLTTAAALKLKPAAERREIPDTGAAGLYLVVQPSGAKSWALRFRRPNGTRAKLVLGPLDQTGKELAGDPQVGQPLTPTAARILAGQINRKRAMGVDVVAARRSEKYQARASSAAGGMFQAAARDFIDHYTVRKTGQKPRRWREDARVLGLRYPLTEGEGEVIVIKGGLCDRWRDRPIAEITNDDIFHLIEEARTAGFPGLYRRNKGASDARGKRMADTLAALFKWLHGKRRITANPYIGTHRPPGPVARNRALNTRTDTRGADETRWFWKACDAAGYPFGDLCKALLLTGSRREEIARMTWAELSDDRSTLRLPGARTKNHLPHDVPLSALARQILAGAPKISDVYVFSTNGTTPVSGFSKYKKRLDALMLEEAHKELGKNATVAPWRVHDLRRSAATGMAGIGIAPHIIEAVLNHVSGAKASVAGIYNREQYEPEKRAALERWSAHLAGIVSGRADRKIVPMRGRT